MIKKLYVLGLLWMAVSVKGMAQTGAVFQLNKLSSEDTLISGWRFHAGDDPDWAKTGFDDSKWKATDPGKDVTDFTELKSSGIGWIRLHIRLDSSLANQQITGWVLQYTASEIYVNGKLVRKYGTIARNPSATQALCPSRELISLDLKPGADQVIAVRLGYQSGIPYISPFFTPLSAFSLYVNLLPAAFNNYQANQQFITTGSIFIGSGAGLFLIISIIYLAYFIFDCFQRLNLYYFLFSVSIFAVCSIFVEFVGNIESVALQMTMDVVVSIFFEAGFLFMLLTIYVLFDYKPRAVFKALVFICCVFFLCLFFKGTFGFILCSNVISILCFSEGARVAVLAIKLRKNGAVIILCGMVLSIIMQIWSGLLVQATILSLVLAVLSFAGFPFGMAIYLGIQYAVTNQSLRKSLNDVQQLSADNLLKEQEKQQILADQNTLLETQVNERTAALNQSITHLKATQTQLIQSEKMASLGELTAGIAHEIQNPLNFVNNFSEVSAELVNEMEEELGRGDIEEAQSIAADVKQNLEKIRHHGKRADIIVKGMLEHSRVGTGEKQPTDLNALADEFLKLSYHGFHTKDRSFNAAPIAIGIVTHFDPDLPKVNVSQRDMGRVMLNLFNNAFYAVSQKANIAGAEYKPEVSVATLLKNDLVMIIVKDNGNGIPDTIKDKIMQPFFTTKPTGEGTGLGLSLSYDIVVKGHGGSIKVNSFERNESTFVVTLPIQIH